MNDETVSVYSILEEQPMNKMERFGFLLTKDEKQMMAILAEIEGGLSQAALIRRLVREAAQKHNILPVKINEILENPMEVSDGRSASRH